MSLIVCVTCNPAIDKIISEDFSKTYTSAGGKGVNVARVLKVLKQSAISLTPAGGLSGKIFRQLLNEEGLERVPCSLGEPLRVNKTYMSSTGEEVKRVVGPDPSWTKADYVCFRNIFSQVVKKAQWVVFSGRLPVGVPEDMYARFIRMTDAKTVADTGGLALRKVIKEAPFLIKPNLEEAQECLGERLSSHRSIKKALLFFHSYGIKKVLLTCGAKGMAASDGKSFLWASGPVLSGHAVGCGDAALAGFLMPLIKKQGLEVCLRWAGACGVSNVPCILPGRFSYQKAVQMKAQINIRAL